MANPVITGVFVNYPGGRTYKLPGETIEVTVDGVDADNEPMTFEVQLRNPNGDASAWTPVSILQSDQMSVEFRAVSAGHTVVANPANSHSLYVT